MLYSLHNSGASIVNPDYRNAYLATTRFGFGAKMGELNAAKKDPIYWLLSQLDGYTKTHKRYFRHLPSSEEAIKIYFSGGRDDLKKNYRKEVDARHKAAIESDTSFYERLVHFWSNHFAVSIKKGANLRILAGIFEREAIRPNINGYFADMLLDVEQHPAMLIYLDNNSSIGPNSRVGRNNARGLNENLAREILELHTLGVDGGYKQKDVRELAKIITGWSIDRDNLQNRNGFAFFNNRHEQGKKTLLGRIYNNDGEKEGITALKRLAKSHATAIFISYKLAKHFVSDTPSDSLINNMAQAYNLNNGHLPKVYEAMLNHDESWQMRPSKIRPPNEYIISVARALKGEVKDGESLDFIYKSMRALGQAPWSVNSPAGYSDDSKDWAGPEALMRRIEWAATVSNSISSGIGVEELSNQTVAPVLSPSSIDTIKSAANEQEAIALLLASPEFQRK